jgi:hypothetical protein
MHPKIRIDHGIAGSMPHAAGADRVVHGGSACPEVAQQLMLGHAHQIGRKGLEDQAADGLGARDRLEQASAVHHVEHVLVGG